MAFVCFHNSSGDPLPMLSLISHLNTGLTYMSWIIQFALFDRWRHKDLAFNTLRPVFPHSCHLNQITGTGIYWVDKTMWIQRTKHPFGKGIKRTFLLRRPHSLHSIHHSSYKIKTLVNTFSKHLIKKNKNKIQPELLPGWLRLKTSWRRTGEYWESNIKSCKAKNCKEREVFSQVQIPRRFLKNCCYP